MRSPQLSIHFSRTPSYLPSCCLVLKHRQKRLERLWLYQIYNSQGHLHTHHCTSQRRRAFNYGNEQVKSPHVVFLILHYETDSLPYPTPTCHSILFLVRNSVLLAKTNLLTEFCTRSTYGYTVPPLVFLRQQSCKLEYCISTLLHSPPPLVYKQLFGRGKMPKTTGLKRPYLLNHRSKREVRQC